MPVAVVDTVGSASTINYVYADGLNTPRAVTDATGTTLWQWNLQGNPFGEQAPVASIGYVFNLRFPGQYADAESGLVHNGFRDYCPACGRYLQSDPTGLNGGLDTYVYVDSNPLSGFDPLGLQNNGRPPAPELIEIETRPETRAEIRAIEETAREEARQARLEREWAEREANGTTPGVQVPRSQFGEFGGCRPDDFAVPTASMEPIGGNGGSPRFLTAAEMTRIQNAANRIGRDVYVVGSRATGTTHPNSDWDYVIEANAPTRNSASRSLPGAGNLKEGTRPWIDVFSGPLTPGAPYVRFPTNNPRK